MFAAPPIANLIVLRSTDIDRASEFYSTMGLLFQKHSHGDGPEHYCSQVNGIVFELYPLKKNQTPTTSARVGFSVDDVDSVVQMLLEKKVKVISQPKDSERGRRAIVKDFDGHTIELIAPKKRDVMKDSLTETKISGGRHREER